MGFYSPSMLVQDARRHGVVVLPPDVAASDWDSRVDADGAVRLGLREISGFSRTVGEVVAVDRQKRPFFNVADLVARVGMKRHDLDLLAAADALQSLAGHRRQAAWSASAENVAVQGDLFAGLPAREAPVNLAAPGAGENLVADYRSLGLTLRHHPLTLLRQHLAERRFLPAAALRASGDRALIRAAGIVVGRQRPGTATGIVFVTLEDESGLTNVVVQPWLVDKQRRELLGATLLGVYGQLQVEGEVVHLVARRLVDLSAWLGRLETSSRDFH
jgi:error-prone DNA polymerase